MFSYKKFAELLDKNNITAYQVSKDTGIYSTLFQIGNLVKANLK